MVAVIRKQHRRGECVAFIFLPTHSLPGCFVRARYCIFFFSRPYMRLPPLIYYIKNEGVSSQTARNTAPCAPRFNLTASPPASPGHTIAEQQLCPNSHPSQLERELFAPFFFLAHAPRCFPGGGGNPQGCTQRNGKPKNPACMLDPKMWW